MYRRMLDKNNFRSFFKKMKDCFYKKKWELKKPYFLTKGKIEIIKISYLRNIFTPPRVRPAKKQPSFLTLIIHFSSHTIAHSVIVIASFFLFSLPKQSPFSLSLDACLRQGFSRFFVRRSLDADGGED